MRLLFINSASYSSEALIREFHRLRPLELLHIVDLMPPFALAGVDTKYYDIIAIQQGDYEEVDWNEVEPLDEPTLLGLAECETVFLKALEKNVKFSKLLDRERYRRRRGLPRVDIFATRASYEYRKHLYLQHLRYWKHVLERHRFDLMVATITPQHGYDYVIYRLCQRMGIPVLFYDIGPVDDWMLPKEDIETPDRAVQSAFAAALAKYGADPAAAPLAQLTERFYREQTSKTKDPTPYYMDPSRTEAFEYGPVRADWRTVKALAHDAAAFLKNWALGGERREAATILAYGWVLRWRKQRELDHLRCYLDSLTTPPDLSRKYIYVPLHFQP